jgi:uncharacterized membrane protein
MGAGTFEVVHTVLLFLVAAIFAGMGVIHFIPRISYGMAAMIPPYLRSDGWASPLNLVYITGVCELLGAIGLIVPLTRTLSGIALVVFLVAVFPANAYAAENRTQFGWTALPLIPRAILQVVLMALVVFVAL